MVDQLCILLNKLKKQHSTYTDHPTKQPIQTDQPSQLHMPTYTNFYRPYNKQQIQQETQSYLNHTIKYVVFCQYLVGFIIKPCLPSP